MRSNLAKMTAKMAKLRPKLAQMHLVAKGAGASTGGGVQNISQEAFVSCSQFRVGIRVVSNRVVFRVVVLLFVLWVSCCSFCAYL